MIEQGAFTSPEKSGQHGNWETIGHQVILIGAAAYAARIRFRFG
jgi:hypothetical protein